MTKNWFPVIDFKKCVACMTCVEFCPHQVYAKNKRKPIVVNPEACIDMCKGCSKICPQEAISYSEEIKGK